MILLEEVVILAKHLRPCLLAAVWEAAGRAEGVVVLAFEPLP